MQIWNEDRCSVDGIHFIALYVKQCCPIVVSSSFLLWLLDITMEGAMLMNGEWFFWTQFNYFIHAKVCNATYVYRWMQKYVVLCKNAIKLMLFINSKHFLMHMYKLPTNAILFKWYIRTNFAYQGWRIFYKKNIDSNIIHAKNIQF